MNRRIKLLVLAVPFLISSAVAAQVEPVFGELVNVELVLVSAFVEDAKGEPVLDLGRDEFEVFEDGKPVEVTQFSAPVGLGSPVSASEPPDIGSVEAGKVIVFIDNLHISPASRHRVLEQLGDFVKKTLSPQDEVMIASYDGTVKVLLPMTRDRGAVRRVLREQEQASALSLMPGLGEERILSLIERFNSERGPTAGIDDRCVHLGWIARTHAEQVYGRLTQTIDELERFVNSLAGFPGRKALIHVSDGVPLVAGLEPYRYVTELCDGSGANLGVPEATDVVSTARKFSRFDPTTAWADLLQFDTSEEWTRLAGHANTHLVSFYTLQASGNPVNRSALADGARVSNRSEMDGRFNRQDSLYLLAAETGGVAMLDSNDFTIGLDRMVGDLRLGYQLAYVPPTPGDGKQHRIEVKSTRRGLEIRHRRSYRSKSIHDRIADGVLSSLLHGKQENPLGVALEIADQQPTGNRQAKVTMRVRVPLQNLVLIPEEGGGRGIVTVFLVARNESGYVTPMGKKTVPLRVPAEAAHREYVYEVEISMRGEQHEVAVALRDEVGGQASYVRKKVGIRDVS